MGPSPAAAPEGRRARLALTRRTFVCCQTGALCAIIPLKVAPLRWLRSVFILSMFARGVVGSEQASDGTSTGSNRIHPVKFYMKF